MSAAARKLLFGLAILLAICLLVGALYGRPILGLAVGALLALAWQIRLMLMFERALQTGDFEDVRYGSGFWAQAYSRIRKLRQRGGKHKRRYRQLLREVRKSTNAMPDGGIILNDRFEIVVCNAAAQQLVGFRPRQDRGQRVDHILRDPKFARYLRSDRHQNDVEIRSPIREGDWLNCRLVPFGAQQYLLLIRDVTERYRMNKVRREFIANASHELRSPLTVITGYLDSLSTAEDAPQTWRKPVAGMQRQAERMNKIVAELLELSRLEATSDAGSEERIDICGLLAEAKKVYSEQHQAPRIEVECASRATLLGSQSEIESVVTNLLSNAIRHTPEDGLVTLSWSTSPEGGLLEVADTGEGIDSDDVPRLTERFFRSDRGRSRSDGGVGLGLAIVKHALVRHDAELEIESAVGAGSSFCCRFPVARLKGADLVTLSDADSANAESATT